MDRLEYGVIISAFGVDGAVYRYVMNISVLRYLPKYSDVLVASVRLRLETLKRFK